MPDLASQVGTFTGQLNGTNANKTVAATATNGRTLVAVWMGLNSLSYAVDQLNQGTQNYQWAQQATLNSANAVATDLLEIVKSPAYNGSAAPPDFLIMPIPPAQTIPTFVGRSNIGGITLNQIANLSQSFNAAVLNGALTLAQALAQDGRGARVFTFDIPCVAGRVPALNVGSGLWTNYTSNPSKYGLSDVKDPCTTGKSGASVCSNPASHLFWDVIHVRLRFCRIADRPAHDDDPPRAGQSPAQSALLALSRIRCHVRPSCSSGRRRAPSSSSSSLSLSFVDDVEQYRYD